MTLTGYMCQEKTEEDDLPDSVDTSIQGLKEYTEKGGGILKTATRKNTNDTIISRMEITRKQRFEEKQRCGRF